MPLLRKPLALASLLVLVLPALTGLCATAPAAPLPLANPGFENGLDGWSAAWEGSSPMSGAAARSARTGASGLRIEDNDTKLGSSLMSDPVPAAPGKTYRLAFQARSFASVWGMGAYLRFRDAAEKFIGEAKDRTVPPDAADWASYDVEAVAPAGTASVVVWFHSFSTTTGAWDVDDLRLEELPAAATNAPAAATDAAKPAYDPAKLPDPPLSVVLKVDDLATGGGNVPARWKRITDFALERKIHLSVGIITQSLATANPSYINYIRDLQKTGLFEFWFHGWDHRQWTEDGKTLQEFKGSSYELQKEHFVKSQALAKEKLGFTFTTFGAPFNATDATTDRVLAEDPDIRIFLYGNPHDTACGKIILDRVGWVNIEAPLFVPNAEKFIQGYIKNAKGRSYYVIQGHPNQWDDARWAEFVKLVDFLQQNHIPIVTPTELAASLAAAK